MAEEGTALCPRRVCGERGWGQGKRGRGVAAAPGGALKRGGPIDGEAAGPRGGGGATTPFLCGGSSGGPGFTRGVRPHTGHGDPRHSPGGAEVAPWGAQGALNFGVPTLGGSGVSMVGAVTFGVPTPGVSGCYEFWGPTPGGSGVPQPRGRERRRGKAPAGPGLRKPPARGSQWPEGGGGTPQPRPGTGPGDTSPSRVSGRAPRERPRTCPGPGVTGVPGGPGGVPGLPGPLGTCGGRGRAGAGPGRGRGAD